MFKRKRGEMEEQVIQCIPDEQLDQVVGGSQGGGSSYVPGMTSSTLTGLISSASVSGVQATVAGASGTTPPVSPSSLLPGLV